MEEYRAAFDAVQADFEEAVAACGLLFEREESQPRVRRAEVTCGFCENSGASLGKGWLSPSCRACRTGEETATFFISLKCTRNCYFCFNVNQEDYEYHRTHERTIAAELRAAHAAGAKFRHLAVTGGEPCLHPDELLAFLHCAQELYPEARTRLYTSGDCLDDRLLAELRDAGLSEIRFSVKMEESADQRQETLNRIAAAVKVIPDVMVEMPVIPGTLDEMRGLLVQLDERGVRGINLLEFCFPLANAEAFAARGFELRRNPYVVPYNYWYAGGLPIAGSEAECLELLRFAAEKGLRLGVHYCSLDNKFSGQIYQQNKPFLLDSTFAAHYAWLSFDNADYFLKCAKVFGDDVPTVERLVGELREGGGDTLRSADEAVTSGKALEVAFGDRIHKNPAISELAFPLAWAPVVAEALPTVELGVSLNVLEPEETSLHLREVALNPWHPTEAEHPLFYAAD